MITYNEKNQFLKMFGDDICLFSIQLAMGEQFRSPSPNAEASTTTNMSILSKGAIRTWNTSREGHLDIEGGPGKIFGGLMLPGVYTIEGIDEGGSVYTCLSRINKNIGINTSLTISNFDFELDMATLLENGDSTTHVQEGRFKHLVCMYGQMTVTANGRSPTTLSAGQAFVLDDGETVTITNSGDSWLDFGWAKTAGQ